MKPIRILIADDHPIVRQGLRTLFAQHRDLDLVAEVADGRALLTAIDTLLPDVVVLDLKMPHLDGIAVLRQLSRRPAPVTTIVLSSYHEPDYVLAAVRAGVSGYLVKSSDYGLIVDTVRAAASGAPMISPGLIGTLFSAIRSQEAVRVQHESGLTAESLQVLAALAQGQTNSEIAADLHWSEVTVKRRVQEILDVLGARNRTQAVVEAVRRGWI